ncbi:MAG TPA: DUF3592 domain-containing protein [Thermoanaerobaculia bacterium]|nr:DUF3592 domain-containing protein [Thermoanaerobaculia bacterium]
MDNLLPYFLTAIGTALVVSSAIMFVKTWRFVDRCIDTDGRVVRYADDLDGDPTFPVVAFEDRTGQTYEITRPSDGSRPTLGTIVRVTYYPPDPANAWAAGTVTPWVIPSVLTLGGVGLIVTAVVLAA